MLLLSILESNKVFLPNEFQSLNELTDFAVSFRYEPLLELDTKLDRIEIIERVSALADHIYSEISKDL